QDPALRKILREMIDSIDFPIVITDNDTLPRAWRGVGISAALVDSASIDSVTMGLAIAPVIQARLDAVRARADAMDRKNAPIPMTQPGTGIQLGAVHYGEPPVLERLRWMPTIAGLGLVLLFSIGLWGLTGIRRAEQRSIWVGMAREAAHYLRRRLPRSEGEVEIRERYGEVPPINLNRELLAWALENVLNNAISAIDKRPGLIEVTVDRRKETEAVEVTVTDNGRGMT